MALTDWFKRKPAPMNVQPLTPLGVRLKAVNGGAAALAWQNDVPLSVWNQSPEAKAAAYLRAYKVGWFYKAESKISLDISNLKRTLSPEDDSGDNETAVLEADLSTPWESLSPEMQFLRLMERPNPSQTGRQLFQKTQIRLDMAGWTFWYMENSGPVGSSMLPTAIYGISPARLTPSFDTKGTLIGWVLDANKQGGGVPFETYEIVQFSQEPAEDMPYGGQGVVEAVASELVLGDQYAKHQSDLLATGGRLAGMLWPKGRALSEDEFVDAQRAWRSVASDPNAARRLLLFPEPMEYATGAADPAAIGIPELSVLNRDNILTAFPMSPYMLGVPTPGGLNSGETRREDRKDYWEGTIHPRVELLEETIQTKVAAATYRVFMLGFVPGFAYLGIVDDRIAMPRRSTPRVRVPVGSVGIAGVQTGIYPAETPGGWQLIGRTPLKPFDPSRENPFLLKAGDSVQFYAIERREYDQWK